MRFASRCNPTSRCQFPFPASSPGEGRGGGRGTWRERRPSREMRVPRGGGESRGTEVPCEGVGEKPRSIPWHYTRTSRLLRHHRHRTSSRTRSLYLDF